MTSIRQSYRFGAIAAIAGLAIAGCTPTGGDIETVDSGEGVPFGASMEDYHAAFTDIDPVEFYTQMLYPEGNHGNDGLQLYYDAITEWSDGKITFDVQYSSAIAPVTETFEAIQDGRLEIGYGLPAYSRQEFPAAATLSEISFTGNQSPIAGELLRQAWVLEMAFAHPEVAQEFQDAGIHPLNLYVSAAANVMFCTQALTSLNDFAGKSVISGARAKDIIANAMGMTPLSLSFTEAFEALQRGIADCTSTTVGSAYANGLMEVVPHMALHNNAGMAVTYAGLFIDKAIWDDLPLVVRQLFFDRVDVQLIANAEGQNLLRMVEALEAFAKIPGSSTETLDDDVVRAIADGGQQILDEVTASSGLDYDNPGDLTKEIDSLVAKWEQIVVGDLGYSETTYGELVKWMDENELDLQPFVDAVFEEILLPHRPQ